jgi:hypothetical protein
MINTTILATRILKEGRAPDLSVAKYGIDIPVFF